MAGLDSLPAELLNCILDWIDPLLVSEVLYPWHYPNHAQRRVTFSSLCLTSKNLLAVAQPYLYKDFRLPGWKNKYSIQPFLRTLCRRPSLAKYVETIQIDTRPRSRFSKPSVEDCALFSKACIVFDRSPIYNHLLYAVQNGCHVTEVLLLLSFTINLRNLILAVGDDPGVGNEENCTECSDLTLGFASVFASHRFADTPRSPFGLLKKMKLSSVQWGMDQPSGTPCSMLSTFVALPNLRTLNCIGFTTHFVRMGRFFNVRSLDFDAAGLDTASLEGLPNSCTALEKLSIYWRPHWDGNEEEIPINIDIDSFQTALDYHKDTLTLLRLLDHSADDDGVWPRQPALQLQGFSKLTHVNLNEALLVGRSEWESVDLPILLPTSLQRVFIRSTQDLEVLGNIVRALSKLTMLTHTMVDFCQFRGWNDGYFDIIQHRPIKRSETLKWSLRCSSKLNTDMQFITFSCFDFHGNLEKAMSAVADKMLETGVDVFLDRHCFPKDPGTDDQISESSDGDEGDEDGNDSDSSE